MEEKRCYGCMKLKTHSPVCEHCGFDETKPNAAHQLPTGTVLKEQYMVGRVLGQGGFGITYLGWDLYLDIPVAVKEYYPSGLVMRDTTVAMAVSDMGVDEGERFRRNKEKFLKEAKALARFSQVPEIVQVRNFFLANNTAYIVMEYVEGITLKQHVKNRGGKLSIDETFAIFRPIMEAMRKVHKSGLVHRDISPDNIMMLPGGGVKLLDFGAVRDVGAAVVGKELTKSTEAILKQGYAPIEQYQKRGSLGPWTDVYALCATMYYCLVGEVPPDAPERLLGYEDLELHRTIPGLREEQEKALEHGMALRAENRIQSMDQLYQELFPPKRAEPVPPPPAPTPAPPPKPPAPKQKRGIGLVWGVSLLLALCLLVGTMLANMLKMRGTCGEDLKWSVSGKTGTLTISGSGRMDDYRPQRDTQDPEELPPWYAYRDQIQTVIFTDAVENVGAYAFDGCTAMTQVQWGSGMEEIGRGAFQNTGLVNVEIPGGVSFIESEAFWQCGDLKTLTVHRSTAISYDTWEGPLVTDRYGNIPEDFTFYGERNSLAEDYANIFGYHYETIGYTGWTAQGSCSGSGVSLVPDKSTGFWKIDDSSVNWHFDAETGLLKLDGAGPIPDYNGTWQVESTELGYDPDRQLPPWTAYNDQIKIVSIGDQITTIGENAFAGCVYLTDVHFGSGLQAIRANAFHSNDLDELVLPDNVADLEPNAFTWCLELKYVQLPYELKTLKGDTFSNCQNILEFFVGPDTILDDSEVTPFGPLTSAGIPGNVTIYSLAGSDAERFCGAYLFPDFAEGYRGMYVRDSGQCGEDMYWFLANDVLVLHGTGSSWLYRISGEDRTNWALENWPEEWLHYEDAPWYPYREEIRHIRILPGVDGLNHNLFLDMPNLQSIDYGTVRETHCTLNNCGIEYVRIPETMEIVGEWSLAWNEKLRVVEIAGGAEEVGDGLFEGCTNLEKVWFAGNEHIAEGTDLLDPPNEVEGSYSEKVVFYVKVNTDGMRYVLRKDLAYRVHSPETNS